MKKSDGFSLVEIMVAFALCGLGLIFVMKQSDNANKQFAMNKIDSEVDKFFYQLEKKITKLENCKKNFVEQTVTFPLSDSIKELKNIDSGFIFQSGVQEVNGKKVDISLYGKGLFLEEERPLLKFEIKKEKYSFFRSIELPLVVVNDIIVDCYDYSTSFEESIKKEIVERLCQGNLAIYDSENNTCTFPGMEEVVSEGIERVKGFSQLQDHTATLAPIVSENVACPADWVKSINANGEISCLNIQDIIDTAQTTYNSETNHKCGLKIHNSKIRFICEESTSKCWECNDTVWSVTEDLTACTANFPEDCTDSTKLIRHGQKRVCDEQPVSTCREIPPQQTSAWRCEAGQWTKLSALDSLPYCPLGEVYVFPGCLGGYTTSGSVICCHKDTSELGAGAICGQ